MNLGYSWSLESESYAYLVSLPKRRRVPLERAIIALAQHPFQASLFSDRDLDGAPLDVIESAGHLITYHTDHAIRRIHVTEIQTLL